MSQARPKKAGAGAKKKGGTNAIADAVQGFVKLYGRFCREASLEPLKLGSAEDGGALSHDELFRKVCLHPYLPGNACDAKAFKVLMDALAHYGHVSKLCLWKVDLGVAGCARLAQALAHRQTLRQLEVVDCGVAASGVAALAEGLAQNKSLVTLTLDLNRLKSAGVEHLAAALESNRTLASLSLQYCDVDDDTTGSCARLAAQSLVAIDFKGNHLGPAAVKDVLGAVATNVSCRKVSLACTGWAADDDCVDALVQAMQQSTTCVT